MDGYDYDALLAERPAPPSSPANEYDVLIAERDREEQLRLRANLLDAQGADPDETAGAIRLSKETGIPPDTVGRNFAAVEAGAKLERDFATVRGHAGVEAWLQQDLVNAQVANDEYGNLTLIQKIWNEIERSHFNINAGVQAMGASVAARHLASLEAAEAKAKRGEFLSPWERGLIANADEIRRTAPAMLGESIGKLLEYKSAADAIPMRPALRQLNESNTWREAWSAFLSDPVGIVFDLTAQNLPQLAVSGAASLAGGPAAGVVTMGGMSFMQEFVGGILENLAEMRVDISDREALKKAFADAELMKKVYSKTTRKAITVGLIDALSMRIASATLAPKAIKSKLAAQAFNMPAQVVTQMVAGGGGDALGSLAAGNEVKPSSVVANAVGELGGAPVEVAGMSVGAGPGSRKLTAPDPVQQAEATATAMDRIVRVAGATKLAIRSPEKLDEFVGTLMPEGQQLYVPAEPVQKHLETLPPEEAQRQAEALGIAQQLPGALAEGGDVAIPLAKYVVEAGRSGAHQAWRDDIRFEIDGLSLNDARAEAHLGAEQSIPDPGGTTWSLIAGKPTSRPRDARVARSIDDVLNAAVRHGRQNVTVELGKTQTWLVAAAKEAGLSIDGFRHTIDVDAVRKIRGQRGSDAEEATHGRIDVDEKDIARIPDVLAAPDKIILGDKNERGEPIIAYEKRMDDGSVLHFEETSTDDRRLVATSLTKRPGPTNNDAMSTLTPHGRRPATDGRGGPEIIHVPATASGNSSVGYENGGRPGTQLIKNVSNAHLSENQTEPVSPTRGGLSDAGGPEVAATGVVGATRPAKTEETPFAKAIHKNSLKYVGDTHFYAIRTPDGSLHKVGESAQGVRVRDGASIRAEKQARTLSKETGDAYQTEIRRNFGAKADARTYETAFIKTYGRLFGRRPPGNRRDR